MNENKFDFKDTLPERIKLMEEQIKLIESEVDEYERLINATEENDLTRLTLIQYKQKATDLTMEITSKKEFLAKLRDKREYDRKEFEKDYKDAISKGEKLIEEADKILDEDEKVNNGILSHKGNMLQFQRNGFLRAKEDKEVGAIVFWYNSLKKSIPTNVEAK